MQLVATVARPPLTSRTAPVSRGSRERETQLQPGQTPDGRARGVARLVSRKLRGASVACVLLAIFLANEICKDHPAFRIVRVRRHTPEIGLARKAGGCFGFSPSFSEWILVLAVRGRL